MACIDMFNTEQQQTFGTPMSPRISFSNDFIDTQQAMKHEQQQQQQQQRNAASRSDGMIANVSSNFEFSVSSYSMSDADEIFSKGRLLPFKDSCSNKNQFQKMTLRDELLVDDDEEDGFTLSSTTRPPKGPIRWKEILGLKSRTHIVSKKAELGSMERVVEGNESKLNYEEEDDTSKISEELLSDEKSSCRDAKSGCKEEEKSKNC